MGAAPLRVLVLGATGLLGSTLAPVLVRAGHEVVCHGGHPRADDAPGLRHADLSVRQACEALLESVQPAVIVNLVGLTDVEACEAQPHQAHLQNVRVLEHIGRWMQRRAGGPADAACHLVHVSTDQVYDGAGPHTEDEVTLTNHYACSKYAGELVARGLPSTILRTNFFGRSACARRASFTDWLQLALREGRSIQVFDDVRFTPLALSTLAALMAQVVRQRPPGLYNLGSHGGLSKADFAYAFAAALGLPTASMRRSTSDQATFLKTYRPKDMRMDSSAFERALQLKLPTLHSQIQLAAKEYT